MKDNNAKEMTMENATATLVIQGVDFENVPMVKIEKMVSEKLIYLGIDGKYHEGYSLEYSEMDFSSQIDATRAHDKLTGYQHNLD
jgi:hypothetical protein